MSCIICDPIFSPEKQQKKIYFYMSLNTNTNPLRTHNVMVSLIF